MAFPTVGTPTSGSQATSTSWTITYPGSIAAGDLLLLFVAANAWPSTPSASGWTVLLNDLECQLFGRKADGSETGNFTLTQSIPVAGVWRVERITAASWHGGSLSAGTTSNVSDGVSAIIDFGSSAFPDPPARVPAWGATDTLWWATMHEQAWNPAVLAYPANYSNTGSQQAQGTTLAYARRELNAATENPGTFELDATIDWRSATVAVRPAPPTPVAGTDYIAFPKHVLRR